MHTADYLELPYHRIVQHDGGFWSAHVLELDGVFSEGATAAEAAQNLNAAMGLWIDHTSSTQATRSPSPTGNRRGDSTPARKRSQGGGRTSPTRRRSSVSSRFR